MCAASKNRLDSLQRKEPDFIEPMECALVSTLPEGPDWTFEVKLDGYRAIGVKTSRDTILYSRNGKNFNKRFPSIAEALGELPADTVVDGEVVALDDSGRPDFHSNCAHREFESRSNSTLSRNQSSEAAKRNADSM